MDAFSFCRRSPVTQPPRARVGRDSPSSTSTTPIRHFNPRARVGRDRISPMDGFSISNFNPRARVGRDSWTSSSSRQATIFQSTRPRGARLALSPSCLILLIISIHAPAWGATPGADAHRLVRIISIHAPAWGATIECNMTQAELAISIHAPAWGATYLSNYQHH